jgi:hypothetical protein
VCALPSSFQSDRRRVGEVDGPWAERKTRPEGRVFDGLKRRWVRWPAGLLFFLFPFFFEFFSSYFCHRISGKRKDRDRERLR